MIHLAVLEPDNVLRNSLLELFEFIPNFSVDYISDNYKTITQRLSRGFEGVVILGLPSGSEIQDAKEAIKQLGQCSGCRVLVLSKVSDVTLLTELLNFGIAGFAIKGAPFSQYITAVEDIATGGAYLSPSVAVKLVSLFKKEYNSELSEREIEVLSHMAKGKSYTSIADELYISSTTVKAHMRNIYSKLQVNNKASAIKKAFSRRILINLI